MVQRYLRYELDCSTFQLRTLISLSLKSRESSIGRSSKVLPSNLPDKPLLENSSLVTLLLVQVTPCQLQGVPYSLFVQLVSLVYSGPLAKSKRSFRALRCGGQ